SRSGTPDTQARGMRVGAGRAAERGGAGAVGRVMVVVGFGIGMLIGMTGMGGGSLMTPLLILVFGIQPVTAVGTDIFYGAVTKTAGGWRHLKHHTVHRGIALWLAVGSVPMAIAGVWLIEVL